MNQNQINDLKRRRDVLRDGRGWYPAIFVNGNLSIVRAAHSSNGKDRATFSFQSGDESMLRCVEYCEWMNSKRKAKK